MSVTLTTKKPTPPDADFAIYIDFKKDKGSPQRVFRTADALITAFEKIDKLLCDSIDSQIKPVMLLEEIETGSLKAWLRSILEAVDDQALKELDWKPAVGKYLVKAKYAIINWTNNIEKVNSPNILQLSNEIRRIAEETDVKYLPDYKNPTATDLIQGIQEIYQAKDYLDKEDRLSFLDKENEFIDFDLSISITPERFSEFLTKEVVTYPIAPMILAVKKPDYLGTSKWELRHGKKAIVAKVEDSEWLKKFQNREVDVRPGDSLRCMVKQEFSYGFDNELIAENFIIVEVKEVLENQYKQSLLFEDFKKK